MNHWEIILGIVFGLLVNEVTDISPWAARKLVRWSAYRWTTDPEMAAGYAEEWAAVIDERPGKLLKLLTALRFALGAAGRAAPRVSASVVRLAYLYVKVRLLPAKPEKTLASQFPNIADGFVAEVSDGNGRRFLVKQWTREVAEALDAAGVELPKPKLRHPGKVWAKDRINLPPEDLAS